MNSTTQTTLEPAEREMDHRLPPLGVPERKPSKGRWLVWLLILGALGYGGYRLRDRIAARQAQAASGKASRGMGPRSVPVLVARARRGDLPQYLNGLGSVTAFNTVTVKSRVDGQLTNVAFQEGQFVHQGDLLAEIDSRPFQVQLEQAEGQIAHDQAQLRDAQVNLDRYATLWKEGVIPKQQYDTQGATVGQFEGSIKMDQAMIDNAKLQLVYSRITAPITGRIGLRLVDVGNMVHATDANGLVVITQLQPIAVLFTIPEDNLPEVLKKMNSGDKLVADAFNRDGTQKVATGTLLTVDNQIDQSTGTSRLKAIFENEDNALFPNQFVNVRLRLDTMHGIVIIPSAALQQGPEGQFVYVVNEDQKAELRPVKVGTAEGGDSAILSGLAGNEQVVIDGQDKLQNGTRVEVRVQGQGGGPGPARKGANGPGSQAGGADASQPAPAGNGGPGPAPGKKGGRVRNAAGQAPGA